MIAASLVGIMLLLVFLPRFLRRVRPDWAERQLLRACNGEVAEMERRIKDATRFRPGMSRAAAVVRALEDRGNTASD